MIPKPRGRSALALLLVAGPALAAHAATPEAGKREARELAAKELAAKELAEVVVTASPLRQSPLEALQPTTLLSGAELVRDRSVSIGETLASQPGITASWFGPQASRPVIRGVGGERVEMLEDGAPALDVSALSSDHAVSIDPLAADRVEVLRGPAVLLYGNGASGGLVNVLTNRVPEHMPARPLTGAVELRGDSALGERGASGRLDGGADGWAWHADAFGRRTHDVSIAGSPLSRELRAALAAAGEPYDTSTGRLPNSWSRSSGGALGGTRIGESGSLGLAVSRYESRYGTPGAESGPDGGPSIDMAQTRVDLAGHLDAPLAGLASVDLRGSWSAYRHAELEADGAPGTVFHQRGGDARLAAQFGERGAFRGTFGANLRDVQLTASGEEAFVPASRTRNLAAFYYQELPLGAFTTELGGRVERQTIHTGRIASPDDYSGTAASFSGGVRWAFATDWSLGTNVTSTTRHPTATELFADGTHAALSRVEIGDPMLRPEKSLGADLSLRRAAGPWEASLTLFATDYSRYIYAAPTAQLVEGLHVVDYREAGARFTGAEGELRLPALELGGVRLTAKLLGDVVRARLDRGGDLPLIPPLRLGTELGLEHRNLSAKLAVVHYDAQRRTAAEELPTDAYTLVGLDVGYHVPVAAGEMLVFLKGDNLLDADARRHSSPLKDYAPLAGRGASLGLRLEF